MTMRVTITRLGHRGDGVADTADGPLFVPFTLPGESVDVQPVAGKERADLLSVVAPSPQRVAPPCPHFGVCGGCALQHAAPDLYADFKRGLVVSALQEAGIAAEVAALVRAHGAGRRRVVFHARHASHDVLAVGFMAARAHRVVPIAQCPVLDPALAGSIPVAWALAEALAPTGKPLDVQVTATEGGLDVDLRGVGKINERLRLELARLATAHDLARLTLHGELIVRHRPPTITIGASRVELPPGSFLQATAAAEEALAALAAECLGKGPVLDLFAGVGTFALRLAERVRVVAADGEAGAIAALTAAVRNTRGLKPVTAEVRDLFRRPYVEAELQPFGTVIFDPPRQGAEAQAQRLARARVPVIVAVSCNPATFARDAALLIAGGYRLTRVVPVDQFLYAPHVELVARFQR